MHRPLDFLEQSPHGHHAKPHGNVPHHNCDSIALLAQILERHVVRLYRLLVEARVERDQFADQIYKLVEFQRTDSEGGGGGLVLDLTVRRQRLQMLLLGQRGAHLLLRDDFLLDKHEAELFLRAEHLVHVVLGNILSGDENLSDFVVLARKQIDFLDFDFGLRIQENEHVLYVVLRLRRGEDYVP